MGIGFVLLIWGIVGLTAATVGAIILPVIASGFTNGTGQSYQRFIRALRLFPFVCLGWAASVFVSYAVVNEVVFHRDPGLGDAWTCPLPNGYALEMIDVPDRGFLFNPKTQRFNSRDSISDVCALQVADRYVVGDVGCQPEIPDVSANHDAVLSYFLLDTRTGQRTDFPTFNALRDAALKLNIQVRLDPIDAVYGRYRFTWFDAVAALAAVGVPLFCAWLLFRWMIRIRNSPRLLPQPA